jgi:hypothetical protein
MTTQTDVNQASSPEQQNSDVQAEPIQPQVAEQATPETPVVPNIPTDLPLPGEGNTPVNEVDERGVSYKNVAAEYKRKLEDVSNKMSSMESTLQAIHQGQQQEQKPQYTIADIEEYVASNRDSLTPSQIGQLEQEKVRIMKEEIVESVRAENTRLNEQKRNEQVRNQALTAVAQNFPQVFKTDSAGNAQWDLSNPLTQRIAAYSKDPSIANRPDGVLLAAKLAYADMVPNGLAQAQTKVQAQQAEIGDLQRRTAIEGAGSGAAIPMSPRVAAINRVRETGERRDGRDALKQFMLDSGRLK